MKAIDKSKLMKRAWYLTKNKFGSFAYNLKKVWAEMKAYAAEQIMKAEAALIPEYQGSTFAASAETMQAYYNSNAYKGD